MEEIRLYNEQKRKLRSVCDENNLIFRVNHECYPLKLVIRPQADISDQITMLGAVEEKGYTSPDASMVVYLQDAALYCRTSKEFTICEPVANRIKTILKKMCDYWLQYFFRDITVNRKLNVYMLPTNVDEPEDTLPFGAQLTESFDEGDPDESECKNETGYNDDL